MREKTKPKVFIVQEGPHDYTPALEFGELDFLATREITAVPMAISQSNRSEILEVKRKLAEYVPGFDYILLAGSPIMIACVVFILSKMRGEHLFLKWDNYKQGYLPYKLNAAELAA